MDDQTASFLAGRTFSNGHRFRVSRTPREERNALITRLARGRRVLHVGCADHVQLISEKRRLGTYLHDHLVEAAQFVAGSDVNREALAAMHGLGIRDLYHPSDLPSDRRFDLVIATDVIEHVGDVETFLRSLKAHACDVLITTPNAMRMANRLSVRSELINTDHRYWFSPYTLAKVLVEAEFDVRETWYTDTFPRRQPVRSAVKTLYPLSRDGLAVLARPVKP